MSAQTCPFCGAELKTEVLGGLCPKCVLKEVMGSPEGEGLQPEDRGRRPEVKANLQS
jgi:hypothetical protein